VGIRRRRSSPDDQPLGPASTTDGEDADEERYEEARYELADDSYPEYSEAYYEGSELYPGVAPAGTEPVPNRRKSASPWPQLVTLSAVAVVAAAVALALTSPKANKLASTPPTVAPRAHQNSAHSKKPPTKGPTASSAPNAGSTAASSTKASSTPGTSTTTTLRRGTTTTARPRTRAENLVISAAAKQSLVATWLAADPGGLGLSPKDVAGTAPGQVYYAYDPSISTYFAVAAFQPSAALTKRAPTPAVRAELRQFQGYTYVFSSRAGSSWALLGPVPRGNCPGQWVPAPVLAVWGMCGFSVRT